MAVTTLLALAVAQTAPTAPEDPLKIERYSRPPAVIERLVTAPRFRNFLISDLSKDRRFALIPVNAGSPSIRDLARPHLNLGGEEICPVAMRGRELIYRSPVGYAWIELSTGARVEVRLPEHKGERATRVGGARWSPDGRWIAFHAHFPNASYLAVAEVGRPDSRLVNPTPLLATLSTGIDWSADGSRVFAVFQPANLGPAPIYETPEQPVMRVTDPASVRQRTFRHLLETTLDQRRLEYFTTGQLASVEVSTGKLQPIGKPAMVNSFNASPEGNELRVTTMQKPFSYLVPASSFGRLEEIWDLSGKPLAEVSRRPISLGSGGITPPPSSRRNLAWHPLQPGLVFLEQEPEARREGGTPPAPRNEDEQARGQRSGEDAQEAGSRRRDRLVHWTAPFGKDDVKVIYTSDDRMNSATFLPDGSGLIVSETVRGTETLYVVRFAEPTKRQTLVSWRTEDFYANPGSLVTRLNDRGVAVAHVSPTGEVFLSGVQYDRDVEKNAPRPFLDRVALADGKKSRVWQSSDSVFESFVRLLSDDGSSLLLSRQSPTDPSDSYVWSASGLRRLTSNQDFTPEITQAQRFRVQITRQDGFKFWARVTMPRWWVRGSRLPAMFWFYPGEFTDQAAYDRTLRTFNKNTFPTTGNTSMVYLTALGYAVVEPDCPIVGPTGRINDNFVPDLRNNLAATIDELERQGFIDRQRLALGGHSYGAFSTVNAMVHTPFFRAGIAGAGNYNRLLTPMAFQSESRVLWEARDTYLEMSPLLYIERLTGALLLYHGMDDQNVGTDPINSERLFHALEGLGKTAALYMYPYEDHGQIARESVLDMWTRWVEWLDRHVMKAR